ncbi:beta-lactamase family protein [Actinomadura soli]|uniref:Beta-lactamase family protein n=1 Tax=Actinomadura soli TaxID=2508997 RepID=A0A5C4JI12_9ACTN|nr:serine hydrolase domain-containing protein [Actinomadura soli]TMR06541.1 beta-lactamase family protein [Actinomadura soli]
MKMTVGPHEGHDSVYSERITGASSEEFLPLVREFDRIHRDGADSNAELCVYVEGEERVSLRSQGQEPDRLQNVRSVSKALLSVIVHALHERGVIDIDSPMAGIWPQFAVAGKESITLATFLSHQAGLIGVDRRLSADDVIDWYPAVEALAAQRPYWEPGTDHGYHDLTFGWGVGEYLRRATGKSVDELFGDEFRKPLDAEVRIGIGAEDFARVVPFQASRSAGNGAAAEIMHLLGDKSSLLSRSQMNPNLLDAERSMRYLSAEVPGCNAVSTARPLARIFAATLGPVDGVRLWNRETLLRASRLRKRGTDRVFARERAYSQGFMLPDPNLPQAGPEVESFGHYGQDCALVFAVPRHNLAFAYTSTQLNHRLDQYTKTDDRSSRLGRMAVESARETR